MVFHIYISITIWICMEIHMVNNIYTFSHIFPCKFTCETIFFSFKSILYIYMDYHIFYSFFHLISYGKRHIIYPIHIFFVNIVFYFYKSTWKTTSTHFTHSNIFIAVSIIILYNSTLITIYTIFILPYYVFITI